LALLVYQHHSRAVFEYHLVVLEVSVHLGTLAKVECVTSNAKSMPIVHGVKSAKVESVSRYVTQIGTVCRARSVLTAPASLAAIRKRTVDLEKFVKKDLVFAHLGLSAPQLAVRMSTNARKSQSATHQPPVLMFQVPISAYAPLDWWVTHL
jgi:hypothetical protein